MLFFCFYGLVLLNLVAFVFYLVDKHKARHGRWRIPERILLLLALFGGSVGALMAMSLVRHKTQKNIFSVGVPLMLILQMSLASVYLYFRFIAD
ncbi:MAG: DUF1294 domain-containing protein [Prevotellaceae bacterium]|nr:DUF1294 domain-containing protein [Prevotellaceae bacterium]